MVSKSQARYAINRPEIDRLASFLLCFGHKSIIALQCLEHDCAISQIERSSRLQIPATSARKITCRFDAHMKGYAVAAGLGLSSCQTSSARHGRLETLPAFLLRLTGLARDGFRA